VTFEYHKNYLIQFKSSSTSDNVQFTQHKRDVYSQQCSAVIHPLSHLLGRWLSSMMSVCLLPTLMLCLHSPDRASATWCNHL